MKITKLLRDAKDRSKCNSGAFEETYKKILSLYENPDHFSFNIRDELKEVKAQSHFKRGDAELEALEQILLDLTNLGNFLDSQKVKQKYGDLTHLKSELDDTLNQYSSKHEGMQRLRTNVSKKELPKPKSIEEVVRAARYLTDFFEKETYRDCVLNILSVRLLNTREGMRVFNEDYADKIRESKYDVRKDLFLPHVDSCQEFVKASGFEVSSTNFSLEFEGRKNNNLGVTVGIYKIRTVLRKKPQSSANRTAQDLLKLEFEVSALKNLDKTSYELLKTENIGKLERIRNNEFSSELEKVLSLLSEAFESRLPRQDVSRMLSRQTKLLYDDVPNPDTDYFKLKGENYSLKIGVKAKGKVNDHSVCVSLEYRKV